MVSSRKKTWWRPSILASVLCPMKICFNSMFIRIFCVGIWTESKEARPSPYGSPRVVGKGRCKIELPEAFRYIHHGKSLPTGGRFLDCLIKSVWNIFWWCWNHQPIFIRRLVWVLIEIQLNIDLDDSMLQPWLKTFSEWYIDHLYPALPFRTSSLGGGGHATTGARCPAISTCNRSSAERFWCGSGGCGKWFPASIKSFIMISLWLDHMNAIFYIRPLRWMCRVAWWTYERGWASVDTLGCLECNIMRWWCIKCCMHWPTNPCASIVPRHAFDVCSPISIQEGMCLGSLLDILT